MSIPPTDPRLVASGPDTRRESVERRILESAQSLIDAGVSWHQLGIRQITEQAEISRTAFYDFFGSKNEVLEHLIRGLHEDLTLNLREALDPDATGSIELTHLVPAIEAVALYATRHGFAYRAFLSATTEDPRLAELWNELIDAYTELIAGSIETVRHAYPEAPREIDAASLSRSLILMTERCLMAALGGQADAHTVPSLVHIWYSSVYGTPPSAEAGQRAAPTGGSRSSAG